MARVLVWFGLGLALMGLLLAGVGALLSLRGGRGLPGDIVISRPGLTVYFPIATSIALSILLTLILWAVAAWRR